MMLGQLNREYAISEAPGPPRFDPRRHVAAEYLERIQRERPDEFQRALVELGYE